MLRRALVVACLATAAPLGNAEPTLGRIDFPVTGGSAPARQHFARGMLALHSFWYDEAQTEFLAATRADASFAMGWWGLAMSHARLLWMDDDLALGREALAKITNTDKLSARERAWVDAARLLYTDEPTLARRKAFAAALEKMHRDLPADDEVSTFYALASISGLMPDDPQVTGIRARAAALAMEVFQKNPQHPGAAHYIIHALDTTELAPLALPAARAYAKIAPEAFHARHMPAHIFSRLGMWSDALASCKSAWDASVAWVKRDKLGVEKQDFHSLNWIMNLEMLQGHRKAAEAALATFGASVRGGMDHGMRGFYVNWVGEYLGYTEEWSRVDELLAPLSAPAVDTEHPAGAQCHPGAPDPDAPPKELFEAGAVTNLRMEVAARLHDVKLTTKLLADADALQEKIKPWAIKQMGKAEWDKHEPERKRMRELVLAAARGDHKKQLELVRLNAVEADKQPAGEEEIFGGGIHAGIAELLMQMKRPKDALAELEPVVKRHPHNSYLLRNAARAAEAAGDHATARNYYQELLDVWTTAEPGTPGLDEARRAMSVAAK